jgi:hypothetical protein
MGIRVVGNRKRVDIKTNKMGKEGIGLKVVNVSSQNITPRRGQCYSFNFFLSYQFQKTLFHHTPIVSSSLYTSLLLFLGVFSLLEFISMCF